MSDILTWRGGVGKLFETLVDLDAGDDAFGCEEIDEILAVIGELMGGLIEEDDAVDVVFEIGGGEEDVAVVAAIFVGVGDF